MNQPSPDQLPTVTNNQTADSSEDVQRRGIGDALGRIPSGLFILTASNEDRRIGMLASWVQQVAFEPPMISVAVAKGRPILALLSESRFFGVCQLPRDEKIIMRKFASGSNPDEDPFLGFEMRNNTVTHVPILANVLGYFECELSCHLDVEGDHELFIGRVRGGGFSTGEPHVHIRQNGYSY